MATAMDIKEFTQSPAGNNYGNDLKFVESGEGKSIIISSLFEDEYAPNIEMQWAVDAHNHAEIYYNLLTSVDDTRLLKISAIDDEIYKHFKEDFPGLKIDVLDEHEIKSSDGKKRWGEFCNQYRDVVPDYNFGTLLRLDCSEDYSESNSTLVLRSQFLAIEIARNRGGYNNALKRKKSS